MSDTFEQIKDIIVELLGVDEDKVTMEARFREDLEADSLDLVELIMAFEDKFGGEISDERSAENPDRRRRSYLHRNRNEIVGLRPCANHQTTKRRLTHAVNRPFLFSGRS